MLCLRATAIPAAVVLAVSTSTCYCRSSATLPLCEENRFHGKLGIVSEAELGISYNIAFGKQLAPEELHAERERLEVVVPAEAHDRDNRTPFSCYKQKLWR